MTNVSSGNNEELIQLIDQYTKQNKKFEMTIPGLTLYRGDAPTQPSSNILDASLCLIAQGKKQVILSEEIYTYDANHFLFTAIDLPVITQIIEASVEQPYLALVLRLDPYVLAQLMLEAHIPFKHTNNGKNESTAISEKNQTDRSPSFIGARKSRYILSQLTSRV